MTAKTNVNDIQVDVNHIAEGIIQRDYENKIHNATDEEMAINNHYCWTDGDFSCEYDIAEDGVPVSVKCEVFGWDYTQDGDNFERTHINVTF